MKKIKMYTAIVLLIFIVFSTNAPKAYNPNNKTLKKNKEGYNVLVDISELKLYLIDKETNEAVRVYPIAGGKPETPSPYGTWKIIGKAANWGAGFGTRWMGLNIPWGQYGIHGTNKPLTINNPDSQGCIRMYNKDVEELYKYVEVGSIIVIYGGPYNMSWFTFRTLKPGDKGADVLEAQRTLKERGYYTGELDGIYGEGMKAQVLKFKKDSKLSYTHYLDSEFYNALGMQAFE